MISYNTKDWFTFIFKFHKADTFRKLMPLIAEEIEDPFGGDENDVPTALLAKNIHRHVSEII